MLHDRICQHASKNPAARIVAAVDVSGGFEARGLDNFAKEIEAAAEKSGATVDLLVFNHAVISQSRLQSRDIAAQIGQIDKRAGGGTSFVEVIERAVALDPSVIVILTDLMGYHGKPPGCAPVLWVTPEKDAFPAPFGETFIMGA